MFWNKDKNKDTNKTNSLLAKIRKTDPNNPDNNKKIYNQKLFYKLKKAWPFSKFAGRIFILYFLLVFIGAFFLTIPGVMTNDKYKWDFFTGMFSATSAFSDTGINIVNIGHDYSFWGQLITLLLIEFGGIGILTFKIFLFYEIHRKLTIQDAQAAQTERGSSTTSSTGELIKDGFIWITFVQITAAFVLFFAFYFGPSPSETGIDGSNLQTINPTHNISRSIWFAIFHSTSAVDSAGFDLVSNSSLEAYNIDHHRSYLIQMVFLIEWIFGGLGYPTFHDIKRKIRARRKGTSVRFSLFTKLNFTVYTILFILGPLLVFATEFVDKNNSLIFNNFIIDENGKTILQGRKSSGVIFMDIVFNTTACRSAGFSTVPITQFNDGSKNVMSVLMFIGAAPSSTAGGIRTTTLAIVFLAIWSIIRNQKQVTAFKKTIPLRTVRRAFAVFFISIAMIAVVSIIIYLDSHSIVSERNSDTSFANIITLLSSTYGTVGISPFTSEQIYQFGVITKICIMFMMFVGQLGISNTLLAFVKPSSRKMYTYLEEDVVTG